MTPIPHPESDSRPTQRWEEILATQKNDTRGQIASALQEILDSRFSLLVHEIAHEFADARLGARRRLAEDFNQMIRRLRQSGSSEEVATWLVDSTSSFCNRAALFEVSNSRVRGVLARGFTAIPDEFDEFEVPLERAPAFRECIDAGDPVIAAGSPGELSPEIVGALGIAPRVHLYPVVVQGCTVAILYAMLEEGPVEAAALEVLSHMAGAAIEALSAGHAKSSVVARTEPAAAPAGLIAISGTVSKPPGGAPESERQLQVRARRFARVQVAAMQLYKAQSIASGRSRRNLYGSLKADIDDARQNYRRQFLTGSRGMADYLHAELVRALARNNVELLGRDYPGALVCQIDP